MRCWDVCIRMCLYRRSHSTAPWTSSAAGIRSTWCLTTPFSFVTRRTGPADALQHWMLARAGNGHDPRALGPFILRPKPKVAPPLERSEPRRAECPSKLLLLPNAQRRFVKANVSSVSPLDDGQESRMVDSFSDILLVERENRDLRTVDGSIVHLRSNVVGMLNPCVEVRQVKHEQSFRSNVVAKVPKGFVHIRGRCKIVERRPEAKKRVKPAAQVKRLHFRPVHVGGDTRSLKVSPGDADHRLRSVPAHDLVTPLYQGKVDGESPAGDVEDISTDRMAVEQISQKGRCSSDAPRVVQSIVVFCDDPIPTGVGLSVLTSREPHAQ